MRKISVLALALCFILVIPQLYSCDVNIFSLVSGTSKSDEFCRKTSEIAELVQNFGQNLSVKEKGPLMMEKLMKKWIDFSGSYDQFPPEWAKNDENWRKKLNDLTDIIGSMNKMYVADSGKAHADTMKFSRRLTFLFEHMPMSRFAKFMLSFPGSIDQLWSAYYEKNLEHLRANDAMILKSSAALADQLPENSSEKVRNLAKIFASSVEDLHRLIDSGKPLEGLALNIKLTKVEEEFAEISKELNKPLVPQK